MRWKVAVVLFVLLSVAAFAANCKDVSFASGNETVNGYLCTPSASGRFPGLVVVHEWWGLVQWPKEQASRLADQGYVTLAPDLYRGKTATRPDTAEQLMHALPPDRARRDLQAATAFLRAQSTVKAEDIGAIGWCMGGGFALQLAMAEPSLKAVVVNYGAIPTEASAVAKIRVPVLGIFGGQDQSIRVETVRQFEQQMKRQGKSLDLHIYPDAPHAFQNPGNTAGYRAQDTRDAQQVTLAFLKQKLG